MTIGTRGARDRALIFGAALSVIAGCDLVKGDWGSEVSFSIDRDRTVVGQTIEVTFDKLNDEGGKHYWIAIQPEDASNTDQTGRIPVPSGIQSMRLTATKVGANEVRVYTESSGGPNMIIARKKLRVIE
ncbi:Hypothetical protein A7982_07172 [Minicystis rosea]|nr:Hypothetical protein A7982_07172 [Minicystis rosea]